MSDQPRIRLRLGWWWLPIIGLGLIAMTAMAGALWLRSDADLDAEVARARSLGLVMDPPPAAVAQPDGGLLHRIAAICEAAPRYAGKDAGHWRWDPFLAPPADAATWSDATREVIDPLLDALSGTATWPASARLADSLPLPAAFDDERTGAVQDIMELRSVAVGTDPVLHARRLALLATTTTTLGQAQHLTSLRLAERWRIHVLRHRDRLEAQSTADAAGRLADTLDQRLMHLMAMQPLVHAWLLRQQPEPTLRALNVRLPAIMTNELGLRVLHRAGRRRVLARSVELAAWIGVHGLPASLADLDAASPLLPVLSWRSAWGELYAEVVDAGWCSHCRGSRCTLGHAVIEQHLRLVTGLRLLAADLAGQPWPRDPGDPLGGRLRPVLRDGVVIGAWGHGGDGIDQGGDIRTDWCWPLRARLGFPRAADAPRDP